jgi:hypothetical protein
LAWTGVNAIRPAVRTKPAAAFATTEMEIFMNRHPPEFRLFDIALVLASQPRWGF